MFEFWPSTDKGEDNESVLNWPTIFLNGKQSLIPKTPPFARGAAGRKDLRRPELGAIVREHCRGKFWKTPQSLQLFLKNAQATGKFCTTFPSRPSKNHPWQDVVVFRWNSNCPTLCACFTIFLRINPELHVICRWLIAWFYHSRNRSSCGQESMSMYMFPCHFLNFFISTRWWKCWLMKFCSTNPQEPFTRVSTSKNCSKTDRRIYCCWAGMPEVVGKLEREKRLFSHAQCSQNQLIDSYRKRLQRYAKKFPNQIPQSSFWIRFHGRLGKKFKYSRKLVAEYRKRELETKS